MPAPRPARQPGSPAPFFDAAAGRGLLAAEAGAMARALAAMPALPWLWVGAAGAPRPALDRPRGVLLHSAGSAPAGATRYAGDLHCALPWPIASDSIGMVLVQHAAEESFDAQRLLDECARVLVPGGTLWLSVLNPFSPYRGRWWRRGLHVRGLGAWQARLRRSGLVADSLSVQWLGPYWRVDRHDSGVAAMDRLRAGVAITVTKRVHAAVPRQPLRRLRLATQRGIVVDPTLDQAWSTRREMSR